MGTLVLWSNRFEEDGVLFLIFFLPAQQSLLKIKFIYCCRLTSVKERVQDFLTAGQGACVGRCAMCAISLAFHKSIKTCCSPGPLCARGMSVFVNVRVSISLPFLVVLKWIGQELVLCSQYVTGIETLSVKLFLWTIKCMKFDFEFHPQHYADYTDKQRHVVNV